MTLGVAQRAPLWDDRAVISIDEFQVTAAAWLAEHRHHGPPDYGAICPPDLVGHGVDWHRRLHDAVSIRSNDSGWPS